MTRAERVADLRLYLVADPDHCRGDLQVAVEAALSGGVTAVQLRAKCLTDRERVELGRALREATSQYRVPLLVNDRLDIALAIGADGVHLGVTDLAPADARRIAPPPFLIGYSPVNEADRSGDGHVDYFGVGPVFGTASKLDAGDALGLAAFARRIDRSPAPVIGIGGIEESNAAAVMDQGAAGVAVISAILQQPDPAAAAQAIRKAIDRSR